MPDRLELSAIRDILTQVQADRDARKVFLAMPSEEQRLAMLGLIAFTNSELANLQKEVINLKNQLGGMEKEMQDYRKTREDREQKLNALLDTSPEIQAMSPEEKQSTVSKIFALATRPAKNGMLLDKILSLIIVIVFIMYATGNLP